MPYQGGYGPSVEQQLEQARDEVARLRVSRTSLADDVTRLTDEAERLRRESARYKAAWGNSARWWASRCDDEHQEEVRLRAELDRVRRAPRDLSARVAPDE